MCKFKSHHFLWLDFLIKTKNKFLPNFLTICKQWRIYKALKLTLRLNACFAHINNQLRFDEPLRQPCFAGL